MRIQKWALVTGALLVYALVWTAPARAAQFESGESYHLGANETVDGNVYAVGETIRIDGKVHGDVVAAGKTVEFGPSAVVDGDVWGAAQAVIVGGRVKGDFRGAGYVVRLDDGAEVDGEMLGAGFSVEVGPSSVLSGELTAAGFQGIVDGTVRGPVRFAGNGMAITGQTLGNVDLQLGDSVDDGPGPDFMTNGRSAARSVAAGLQVGAEAELGGNLRYSAASEARLPSAWQARSRFDQSAHDSGDGRPEDSVGQPSPAVVWLRRVGGIWLGLIIVALLVGRLLPRWSNDASETVARRPLPSLGIGILVALGSVAGLVALVVAVIMALIFVGTIGLDALVGPVLALAALMATALTAGVYVLGWVGTVAVAASLARAVAARMSWTSARMWPVAVSLLALAMLFGLPEVGDWVRLAVTFLGLGALLLSLQPRASSLSPTAGLAVN